MRLVKILLVAAALGHLALFCFIAAARLAYPFELEWMEGSLLVHVARVLEGRPLYGEPNFQFVPLIYPPLYYCASAAAARVFGAGLPALRLVSFSAALVSLGLIFALARRESGSRLAGLLAAGLYAAAYPLSGFWFDLARVDSLFLALVLGGVYALRTGGRRGGLLQARGGLSFAAAFFAKQTALLIAAPLALHAMLFQPWRRKWIFPLALALPIALGAGAFDRATQGWFSYYIFKLPARHPLDDYHLWRFWALDLAAPLPVACGLAALWLIRPGPVPQCGARSFYGFLALGAFGAAWSSRLHSLGFSNVVMPAYAALSVLFGLAAGRFVPGLGNGLTGHNGRDGRRQDALAMALLLVQFGMLFYDPRPQVPTRADRQAGEEFVGWLRAHPGEVLAPYHDYLVWLAGKPSHAHLMAINDVVRGDPVQGARLEAEIRNGLRARRWAAICLDSEWYPEWLEPNYDATGYAFRGEAFKTRIGMEIRPGIIYTPKQTE